MNPSWRRYYLRYRSFFLNVINQYKKRDDVKSYLEILLSLATISAFSILALRPTLLTIAGVVTDIQSKEETVAMMDEKIQNLSRAQSLYDLEKNRIALLDTAIPTSPTPDVFTRQMEGLTSQNQTSLTQMSFGESVILGATTTKTRNPNEITQDALPGGANEIAFSVGETVSNQEFLSLSNYLKDLERLRRPIKIDVLSLRRDKDEEPILVLTIDGRLPFYNQ